MTLGLLFWIIVLFVALWHVAWGSGWAAGPYGPIGGGVLLLVLVIILGVHAFGGPIK